MSGYKEEGKVGKELRNGGMCEGRLNIQCGVWDFELSSLHLVLYNTLEML